MDINDSEVTLSQRLQILTAEHSSLVATRALAWSEAFSRTTMFLAVLSGSVVAIALVAQASAFGDAFALFALVLLPMVLFLGVATFFRLSAVNYHDGLCVAGMNRIRHAYLEAAPDLKPHLVMGAHDDREGLLTTMAMPPGMSGFQQFVSATPQIITVINSIVAGVIAGVAMARFNFDTLLVGIAGLIGFAITLFLHLRSAFKAITKQIGSFETRFPGEPLP